MRSMRKYIGGVRVEQKDVDFDIYLDACLKGRIEIEELYRWYESRTGKRFI